MTSEHTILPESLVKIWAIHGYTMFLISTILQLSINAMMYKMINAHEEWAEWQAQRFALERVN